MSCNSKTSHYDTHCYLNPVSMVSTYPGSCKKELFCIPVFGGKVSLIFLTIDWPMKWPKLIYIFGLVKLFDLCRQHPGSHNYPILIGLEPV